VSARSSAVSVVRVVPAMGMSGSMFLCIARAVASDE
jgi:hypothetical protein